jgi:hypothetical protein
MYTISLLNKLKKINLTQSLQTNPSRKKQKKIYNKKVYSQKIKIKLLYFLIKLIIFVQICSQMLQEYKKIYKKNHHQVCCTCFPNILSYLIRVN